MQMIWKDISVNSALLINKGLILLMISVQIWSYVKGIVRTKYNFGNYVKWELNVKVGITFMCLKANEGMSENVKVFL